jgi:hypothetical protein
MLSSFVPGVTGPLAWSSPAISRSSAKVKEMMELGYIKKQLPNGETVVFRPPEIEALVSDSKPENYTGEFPLFLDGGLSNAFPVIDEKTVVCTPICGIFDPNPSVCPEIHLEQLNDIKPPNTKDDNNKSSPNAKIKASAKLLCISDRVKLHLNRQNAFTMRRIVLSSDDENLQHRYSQGYDDAMRFLEANNLTAFQSTYVAPEKSSVAPKKNKASKTVAV